MSGVAGGGKTNHENSQDSYKYHHYFKVISKASPTRDLNSGLAHGPAIQVGHWNRRANTASPSMTQSRREARGDSNCCM